MMIKIHTQGIKGSELIKVGEHAEAMFGGILEVNGHVIDRISKIEMISSEDFTIVKATFIPGDVEVLTHGKDSWDELCERANKGIATARRADGRLIARTETP